MLDIYCGEAKKGGPVVELYISSNPTNARYDEQKAIRDPAIHTIQSSIGRIIVSQASKYSTA
jgi:hypothetical protein